MRSKFSFISFAHANVKGTRNTGVTQHELRRQSPHKAG
jgi:hypothetical protein